MRNLLFLILIVFFTLACGRDVARIDGEFVFFEDGRLIVLEKITTTNEKTIDSTYTQDGKFLFKVKLSEDSPILYNVKHDNEVIPLVVERGDKISLKSIGDISSNYRVEGSKNSLLLKEIQDIMNVGALSLDSLYKDFVKAKSEDDRRVAAKNYREKYFKIKRKQLAFIVENNGTIAAVYALFQRLPEDAVLFTGDTDVVYYTMVRDSILSVYPTSPYVSLLDNEIASQGEKFQKKINSSAEHQAQVKSFPEIDLKDMYGVTHSLSGIKDKVILLNFYYPNEQVCRLDNAELKEIYAKYSSKGFEIYQVSLDEDKFVWVSNVQDQKLPWICVSDFKGKNSIAAKSYNVKSVPSSFLIDKNGEIVARNVFGENLEKLLKKML
ncbi:MAG: TlpA disulfide reductase family protein [Rikenellaceae bacterium]